MKKGLLSLSILLSTVFVLTSCEERITYKWSEINESLGLLQEAREELEEEISDLEDRGYDTYELESIDDNLRKVERILGEHFH